MLEIKDNRVYLTRGDSASIIINLTDALGGIYTPIASDKLYFRLKKNIFGDSLILVKAFDIETQTLHLTPSDTKNLDFTSYRYEVELVTSDNQHYTVIEDAPFIIGAELETRNE